MEKDVNEILGGYSILKNQIESLIRIANKEGFGKKQYMDSKELNTLFTEYCVYRNGFPFPNAVRYPQTFEYLYQNIYLPITKTKTRYYVPEKYIKKYFKADKWETEEAETEFYLYGLLTHILWLGEADTSDSWIGLWFRDITASEIRSRIDKVIEANIHETDYTTRYTIARKKIGLIDFDDFMFGKKPPTIMLVKAVCRAYRCSADYLLGLSEK